MIEKEVMKIKIPIIVKFGNEGMEAFLETKHVSISFDWDGAETNSEQRRWQGGGHSTPKGRFLKVLDPKRMPWKDVLDSNGIQGYFCA